MTLLNSSIASPYRPADLRHIPRRRKRRHMLSALLQGSKGRENEKGDYYETGPPVLKKSPVCKFRFDVCIGRRKEEISTNHGRLCWALQHSRQSELAREEPTASACQEPWIHSTNIGVLWPAELICFLEQRIFHFSSQQTSPLESTFLLSSASILGYLWHKQFMGNDESIHLLHK